METMIARVSKMVLAKSASSEIFRGSDPIEVLLSLLHIHVRPAVWGLLQFGFAIRIAVYTAQQRSY